VLVWGEEQEGAMVRWESPPDGIVYEFSQTCSSETSDRGTVGLECSHLRWGRSRPAGLRSRAAPIVKSLRIEEQFVRQHI
jgi:hypothetical protein